MTKFLDFLKKQPMLTGVIAVALSVTAILSIRQDSYWSRCVLRILMCATMLFLLWLISGEKTLSKCSRQTGYVLKNGSGILIVALFMGAFSLVSWLSESGGMPEGWLTRLIVLFFMFLFACLFEELCFRAVLNDAIVYQFRSAKHVFVWSALITSLVFGAVHCMGSSLTTAAEWAQAALKTLQCAVVGFAFLILYWKTRNIWACGLLHAGFDFLSSPGLLFESNAKIGAGSYVSAGQQGLAFIWFYLVVIAILSLITWRIWKKVGTTIDFEELRESW